MKTPTRIYEVRTSSGTRLVRAANRAQAIHHVARNEITAEVADQQTLVNLVRDGITVEVSAAPAAPAA